MLSFPERRIISVCGIRYFIWDSSDGGEQRAGFLGGIIKHLTVVIGGLQELGDVECGRECEHGQQILEHAAPQGGAVVPRLAVVERVVHGRVSGGQARRQEGKK